MSLSYIAIARLLHKTITQVYWRQIHTLIAECSHKVKLTMLHLHILGSRLHSGDTRVPRCIGRVPQGELQRGGWKGRQVKIDNTRQQEKVQISSFANKLTITSQDSSKRPEKPRRVSSWVWLGPKLGERESDDGKSCLRCSQTNWMPTATMMLSKFHLIKFEAVNSVKFSAVYFEGVKVWQSNHYLQLNGSIPIQYRRWNRNESFPPNPLIFPQFW